MGIVKLDQPVNQQMDIQCKLERECQRLSFEMNIVINIRRSSLNHCSCKKIHTILIIVFLLILFTSPNQI